ncbi:hypothetical protein C0992_001344, partial [Termitomyces sp. T32_za158]
QRSGGSMIGNLPMCAAKGLSLESGRHVQTKENPGQRAPGHGLRRRRCRSSRQALHIRVLSSSMMRMMSLRPTMRTSLKPVVLRTIT